MLKCVYSHKLWWLAGVINYAIKGAIRVVATIIQAIHLYHVMLTHPYSHIAYIVVNLSVL